MDRLILTNYKSDPSYHPLVDFSQQLCNWLVLCEKDQLFMISSKIVCWLYMSLKPKGAHIKKDTLLGVLRGLGARGSSLQYVNHNMR